MKRLGLLLALVCTLALTAFAEPRNIRFRVTQAPDSVNYRIQWTPPPRANNQTPIEGYDWELWISANDSINRDGTLDDLLASGATPGPNIRRVDGAFAFSTCPYVMEDGTEVTETWIASYVRATGDFNAEAPWGKSDAIRIACALDDSPPGPPVVDLDTLQVDLDPTLPDSTRLMPVALGPVDVEQVSPGLKTWTFETVGDVAKVCAIAYRDGVGYLAPRILASSARIRLATDPAVVSVEEAEPMAGACWYLTAEANGESTYGLCDWECPPPPLGPSPPLTIVAKGG